MKIGVIKAYIKKELIELIRSKMILIIYILPLFILIIFGYGIKLQVTHAKTIIIDYDKSKLSKNLIDSFQHSKYFDTTIFNGTEKEALHKIKEAKEEILLIIPQNFERNLIHGVHTEIASFIDGAFPIRGETMSDYVKGVIYHMANELVPNLKPPIEIDNRNLFNQAMRDENAIVPGLIGLVLLVAPAILSALLIVKEKEEGTIFNFYSSPVKKNEFIIAKLIPAFLLHSINIFILFLIATYIFNVPFRGSFSLYWLTSELYILISLGIGLLVSIITSTQIVAIVLTIIITIIPGFLYSGMLMPISSMSSASVIEAHIYPIMYYNHLIYDSFLIGEGLKSQKNSLYFLILILYTIAVLSISISLIKKELKR